MAIPAWFWHFAAWRNQGGIPSQRPKDVPYPLPRWVWPRYLLHRGVVKPAVKIITSAQSPAQWGMYCAGDALNATRMPLRYRVLLSADQNQRWITDEIVRVYRAQGRKIDAWCDCDQTPPSYAIAAVENFKLDGWVGQGETPAQFKSAYDAGATRIIGVLSALEPWQKELIRTGKVLWIEEDYWNAQPWLKPDWQGLPVAGSCAGVYDASGEQKHGIYIPLSTYKAAGRFSPGTNVYFNGGMQEPDWAEL